MRSDGATCAYCGCLPTPILKRMPTTPLTLLVAHLLREQVKVQEESSPETDFLADPRAETSKYG